NPADKIVVVVLLADTGKVSCELRPLLLVTLADGVTSQTPSRFQQFLAMSGAAGFVFRQSVAKSCLPDVSGNRADLLVVKPEVRHFCSGPEGARLFEPHGNPVLVQFQPNIFEVGADLFHVLQQALGSPIELNDTQVELAIGHFQSYRAIIQAIRFFVGLRSVGLLHQIVRLLKIVFLLLLDELDLLSDGEQVLGLFVIALIAMAAHAAALAKQILAFGEGPANVVGHEYHVRGMAGLAAGFDVSAREQGPEPVLVIAVSFFNTGGGASVTLVAWRAAKLVRVVNLQEIGFRMAGEGTSILVGLFALGGHADGRESNRLPDAHMTGLTAIHDIRFRYVDLDDLGIPGLAFIEQSAELGRSQVDHVLGDIRIELFFLIIYGLDEIAKLGAEPRAFVA